MLEIVVLFLYSIAMLLLATFAFTQLALTLRRRRVLRAPREAPTPLDDAALPFVTVQLPIYNELHVAPRLLECIAALDYPRERLEIHVLDDSTDETRALIDACVARLRAEGTPIEVLRRAERSGFKAGALRDAMARARGEFIAIFDADFLPRTDFLRVLLPYFAAGVAVVQARWGYLDERASLLTRIQAFFLDVHFTAEQTARTATGCFANFNGTAGIWRRRAIDDAGGWRADTLTEDVDLSYRAQLRGWTIRYLEQYLAPSELPVDASGFRSQQFRWMKGGAENARLHLRNVLSAPLPRRVKYHALEHLLSSSVYIVLLASILLSVPLAFLKNSYIAVDYVHFGMIFFTSTLALGYVYYSSRGDEVATLAGKLRFAVMMVVFLMFTMGLALHNGIAALRGWLGERTPFERTPKYGAGSVRQWTRSVYAGRRLPRGVFAELALAGYAAIGIVHGLQIQDYGMVPLQSLAFTGLCSLAAISFRDHRMTIRAARHVRPDTRSHQPSATLPPCPPPSSASTM